MVATMSKVRNFGGGGGVCVKKKIIVFPSCSQTILKMFPNLGEERRVEQGRGFDILS